MCCKTPTEINWLASRADAVTIDAIVARAREENLIADNGVLELQMDLTALHLNGTPLNLRGLLHAGRFDFAHDITGIMRNIVVSPSPHLRDLFMPRYSA
jgi:hypothetical protein